MPKLSDSMEEGKIIQWKVAEGQHVSPGDVLAEIESDKATMELECFTEGVVSEIVHGDGSEVRVGAVIARIAGEGEAEATAAPAKEKMEPRKKTGKEVAETKEARKAAAPGEEEEQAAATEAARAKAQPAREMKRKAEAAPKEAAAPAHAERIAISPYARKLAEQRGVDLTALKGSGPGGRIVATDVEAAARSAAAAGRVEAERPRGGEGPKAPPAPAPADEELPPVEVGEDEADVEQASYRHRTQARIVTAAKHAIPHFYMTRGAEVTRLLARKEELKQKYDASITHVVILAVIEAIKAHPEVNRSYDRGNIIRWKGIHIGIAVQADEGLTVAVLRDAQDMSLEQIVPQARHLVEKARAGRLSADERRHPTFTISNLGMFDVEHFEPIINPPSAVTLGVATPLPTAVARGDAVGVGMMMRLTISCDHRIIDGVTAAKFLGALRQLLENPDELLKG
jgi:pyruvate dehydrogenase E2 component (dihydrolipoamide acetyltransferase)